MPLITTTPEWRALKQHWQQMSGVHMRELFANDPGRAERMTLDAAGLHLDYSKNIANERTLALVIRSCPLHRSGGLACTDVRRRADQ